MFDSWNPETFSNDVITALCAHSKLIRDYFEDDERELNEKRFHRSLYRSPRPNQFDKALSSFRNCILIPILTNNRARVWHYTRLTDDEVNSMSQRLVPSSIEHLRNRLNRLVANGDLSDAEATAVDTESPLLSQPSRKGQFWATDIPSPPSDSGVEPLLKYWGGESVHFRLETKKKLLAKLRRIGAPRIIELESALSKSNAEYISGTVLRAWARKIGMHVNLTGCDLCITNCTDTAKVVRIHTQRDGVFETVATTYPKNVCALLENG